MSFCRLAPSCFTLGASALIATSLGCGDAEPLSADTPKPSTKLSAQPRWLAWACVDPTCRQTRTATVSVEGPRDIVVQRIALSDPGRTDFEVNPARPVPVVLSTGEHLAVTARYTPTVGELSEVDLLIAYADASPNQEDPARIEPTALAIPLLRRTVGEPRLTVEPGSIHWGTVAVAGQRWVDLAVRNDGSGNIPLEIDSIESDHSEAIRIDWQRGRALWPGESAIARVTYAPRASGWIQGSIRIHTFAPFESSVTVPYLGTSIDEPRVEVSTAEVDFGAVPMGHPARVSIVLSNRGADDLIIDNVRIAPAQTDNPVTVVDPSALNSVRVPSLESVTIEVALDARRRGPLQTSLLLDTNDPQRPTLQLPVRALITAPELHIAPPTLDFGDVPRGWTALRPVELTNVGYGDLEVANIGLVLGSSHLFTLRNPALPTQLKHNQSTVVQVEFRAEATASFAGHIVIESNDADRSFAEVAVSARGASCEQACPILNGTPTCANGVCQIDRCADGYYDTDRDPVSGCECADPAPDPGPFCQDAADLGRLDDDGSTATLSGLVPVDDDQDLVRVFAYDEAGFFSDAFDVRIALESADPNVRMCIYRHDTDAHLNQCFYSNEICPPDGQYRRDGAFGRDDSADFTIRIFRRPRTTVTCAPYTLSIRNG